MIQVVVYCFLMHTKSIDELGLVEHDASLDEILEVRVDATADRRIGGCPLARVHLNVIADEIEWRAQVPERVERSHRCVLVHRVACQPRECTEFEQKCANSSHAIQR